MMKLILSLTLIWMLSSTGGALECYGNSDRTVSCQPNEYCVASAATHSFGITRHRGCSPNCKNQIVSYNVGFWYFVQTDHCCNTDLCNNQDVPYPEVPKENGLQCFTCENPSSLVCDKTVQCLGIQDRCIRGIDGRGARFVRCVSKNVCEAGNTMGISDITCCKSNLCNSA